MKILIQIGEDRTPQNLQFSGLKILVDISMASTDVEEPKQPRKHLRIWAKIDTAAYKTHLSQKITDYLDLISKGERKNVPTGGGLIKTKTFAVDLKFVDYGLKPFINLEIGSLEKFPFDLTKAQEELQEKRNIGVLIGRDILSGWNLNWDGPTSTVTISD